MGRSRTRRFLVQEPGDLPHRGHCGAISRSRGPAPSVLKLDASTGAVVQTFPVGLEPYGVSSDGTHVWVTNVEDNTVSEIGTGAALGFAITTSSLPSATPGVAYGPVTLQEAGAGTGVSPYVTTFKEEDQPPQGTEAVLGRGAVRDSECQAGRRAEFGHGSGDQEGDHPQRQEEGQDRYDHTLTAILCSVL